MSAPITAKLQHAPVAGERLMRCGEHCAARCAMPLDETAQPLRAFGVERIERLVEQPQRRAADASDARQRRAL